MTPEKRRFQAFFAVLEPSLPQDPCECKVAFTFWRWSRQPEKGVCASSACQASSGFSVWLRLRRCPMLPSSRSWATLRAATRNLSPRFSKPPIKKSRAVCQGARRFPQDLQGPGNIPLTHQAIQVIQAAQDAEAIRAARPIQAVEVAQAGRIQAQPNQAQLNHQAQATQAPDATDAQAIQAQAT